MTDYSIGLSVGALGMFCIYLIALLYNRIRTYTIVLLIKIKKQIKK